MNTNTEERREIANRLKFMQRLAQANTRAIRDYLTLPSEQRIHGMKLDGTNITLLDYENDLRSLRMHLKRFPEDSFHGEELVMIRPKSSFTLLEDPVDMTAHAICYTASEPDQSCWPTHMLSLLYKGKPVAFTLGVPLRDEIYSGSVNDGVFLNGKGYKPAREPIGLIVGQNESSYGAELQKLIGYNTVGIAGVCTWLILQGVTSGGILNFTRLPHETACIAAAVLSAGGRIGDSSGRHFQPYHKTARLVWGFGQANFEMVINSAGG